MIDCGYRMQPIDPAAIDKIRQAGYELLADQLTARNQIIEDLYDEKHTD